MKAVTILFCSFFIFIALQGVAQENHLKEQHTANSSQHPFTPTHYIGLAISHAHVFNGRDAEGNRKTLSLPMWGLDYNYQFAPRWLIGLHTDIIVETFKVEKNLEGSEHAEVVERSKPVAPAIMGFYKPNHHWAYGFGIGGEFAKEENYFLNRAAIEYSAEINEGWEVFGVFQYDFRWNAYDTWSVGIGISKALGKSAKSHHK